MAHDAKRAWGPRLAPFPRFLLTSGFFSFPAAHWVPVPTLPLQLPPPPLPLKAGPFVFGPSVLVTKNVCGVLPGKQQATLYETLTHVRGGVFLGVYAFLTVFLQIVLILPEGFKSSERRRVVFAGG